MLNDYIKIRKTIARIEATLLNSDQVLDLSNLELSYLPEEISLVYNSNITEVNLSNNSFPSIPEKILRLKKLQSIDLSKNGMTYLPNFSQETSITSLNLSSNQLSSIDFNCKLFSNVQVLDLSNCNISKLPEELDNLSSLKHLNLSNNFLRQIPENFKSLVSIEHINLSNNQLSTLPITILELENFLDNGTIVLKENLFAIPPELFSSSTRQQIRYITRNDKVFLNEAKLILIGDGDVGKTAIVNRLVRNQFIPGTKMTPGINIEKWIRRFKENEVTLHLWDFGGQEIMHAMHQFFMTKRSLYLLVCNARENNEQKVENWLKLIRSFGGDSPVLLVINKTDDGNYQPDINKLKDKYGIIDVIRTSCLTGQGINTLKRAIKKMLPKLEHLSDKIPIGWLEIKNIIEHSNKNFISLDQFFDYCEELSIVDFNDQISLLNLLNDLGSLFNYGSEGDPAETNILNPEWATKAIYRIINSKLIIQNYGKLVADDLKTIFQNDKDYPLYKLPVILGIMEKFELSYYDAKSKTHLIPDLFPTNQPFLDTIFHNSLEVEYKYDFLPSSVMPRFLVKSHELTKPGYYWKNGIILIKERNRSLIFQDLLEKTITVKIVGPNTKARNLFTIIQRYFEEIHGDIANIQCTILVKVPDRPNVKIRLSHLLKLEELGEEYWIPEGMTDKVRVSKILSSYRTYDSLDSIKAEKDLESLRVLLKSKETYFENLDLKREQMNTLEKNFSLRINISFTVLGLLLIGLIIGAIIKFTWNNIEPIAYVIGVGLTVIGYFWHLKGMPKSEINKIINKKKNSWHILYDYDPLEIEKLETEIFTIKNAIVEINSQG